MLNETKKMVELIDEMMECVNGMFDLSMLEDLDGETFKMMKLYLKTIDLSKEYMLKQAEEFDKQGEKLDLILKKLEKMEKKS